MIAKISPIQNKISSVSTVKQTVDNKINLNDLDVPDQFRSKIKRFILENKDLFASKDSELGHTDIVKIQVTRKLNQITKKNSYPLPLIDDILALFGKAKYFSSLDLKSGYWQVAMNEKDKEKTAFACHRGLFEFNVMPFGLSNAPAIFQELMSVVLQDCSGFATAYLDDLLIFSESLEEHVKHIGLIFMKLRQHNLKLKL